VDLWELGNNEVVDGVPWSTLFAMAVWWGSKWRCGTVFGENGRCRDRVRFVKELAKEVMTVKSLHVMCSSSAIREERLIEWKPSTGEWVKLNTDGASKGNPGLATASGALRDGAGNWCGGFAVNLGRCAAPLAELWGVL